jgi:hypothetical protein
LDALYRPQEVRIVGVYLGEKIPMIGLFLYKTKHASSYLYE